MFQGVLNESLLKKAQAKGLFSLSVTNIRDFATDKHGTADDTVYGGGSGMLMKADVIAAATSSLRTPNSKLILMTPAGKKLDQKKVNQFSKEKHLIIICGHYEGVDERVREMVDEEISIGDYVLTGGEIPAMVLVDAAVRQIPKVVKEHDSLVNDSFYNGLLDHPSYTKPEDFDGRQVPEVLRSGNHKEINRWRRQEALRRTLYRRPGLLAKVDLDLADRQLLNEIVINE